jgi:hypothetical protein
MVGSPHPINVTSSTISINGSKLRNTSISKTVGLKSAAFLPHIIQFKLQALVNSNTSLLGYDSKIVLPASNSSIFLLLLFCCFSVNFFPLNRFFVLALKIIFLLHIFYTVLIYQYNQYILFFLFLQSLFQKRIQIIKFCGFQ